MINAHIVEVNDNNDIDREVTKFRPDIVVIEALWVVPEKFPILKKLHPKVKWFCHLHSQIPFLSLEGNAMDWAIRYQEHGVGIIANAIELYDALKTIIKNIVYLPNVYLSDSRCPNIKEKDVIDIGCFGAIRPLKNQLLQALAAIQFAKEIDKFLFFHINSTRQETNGAPVLKNIRQLFALTEGAVLFEHDWMEPEDFIHMLHRDIDIGMQVSLTETFNVVSADYVTAGVPMVVSDEVRWASHWNMADKDDMKDIVKHLHRVHASSALVRWNQRLLHRYSSKAQKMWHDFVYDHRHHHG